jgi:hypothetical protein
MPRERDVIKQAIFRIAFILLGDQQTCTLNPPARDMANAMLPNRACGGTSRAIGRDGAATALGADVHFRLQRPRLAAAVRVRAPAKEKKDE